MKYFEIDCSLHRLPDASAVFATLDQTQQFSPSRAGTSLLDLDLKGIQELVHCRGNLFPSFGS